MNLRNASILLFLLVVTAGLVYAATVLQAGSSFAPSALAAAQRHAPSLWILDGMTLLFLAQTAALLRMRQKEEARLELLRCETQDLIEVSTRSAEALNRINAEQSEQIVTLQSELNARREAFEAEARRLTEQAFRSLTGQVEANARQLDAVNLALQYHRAQLQQINQGPRLLKSHPGASRPFPLLTPAEMAAIEGRELPEELPQERTEEESLRMIYSRPEAASDGAWSSPTQNAPSTIIANAGHFAVDSDFYDSPLAPPIDPSQKGQSAGNGVLPSNASPAEAYLDALINRSMPVPETASSPHLEVDSPNLSKILPDPISTETSGTEKSSEWHRRL